jgi:hypothetical protein
VIPNDEFELNPAANATYVIEITKELIIVIYNFRNDGAGNR